MFITILSFLIVFFSFLAGIAYIPMHSILSMLVTYLCAGILFMYFGLEFIGLIYIIVYAGAIVILFIFILMLTNQPYRDFRATRLTSRILMYTYSAIVACAILVVNRVFNEDSLLPKRTNLSDFSKDSDLEVIAQFLYDMDFMYVLIMAIVLFIALVSVVISTTQYKGTYVSRRSFNKVYKVTK